MLDDQKSITDGPFTITARYGAGSYVARVKGYKGSASSTISAKLAAEALARKLEADPAVLTDITCFADDGPGKTVFDHPGMARLREFGESGQA